MAHQNAQWDLPEPVQNWEQAGIAVLMDIRAQLQSLNRVFQCSNFTLLPSVVRLIAENTKKTAKNTTKKKRAQANRVSRKKAIR